ncbi:hypothetical protein FHG87_015906 [Trinorchestia longiramus]|nr:hypothetical protein FHG87_015906 [Trinorchestia longiramus]
MRAPLTIAIALAMFTAPAVGRSHREEPPSLISAMLDLLPEVEAITAKNSVQVDVPRVRKSEINNIIEIFDMFIPFMKEVLYNRAEETGEEVSEETYENIATMERLFPKLINLVVAISTRPQSNPDDEPALPDYRSIAKGSRKVGSSEEDGDGNFVELPKLDKKVLRKVLNQTTQIISQISRASTSGERSTEKSDSNRNGSNRPYYIGSSSTTRRPYTPRKRTYSKPTTTPRSTYTTTAKAPRVYATTSTITDEPRLFRYNSPTESLSGAEQDEEAPESYTPGAQVPFFNLPASGRRSYQRVTRGSPDVEFEFGRQLKPRKYFYI